MTQHATFREAQIARENGWRWTRVAELEPGDVQRFAGHDMRVTAVRGDGRFIEVEYDGFRSRVWSTATEVGLVQLVAAPADVQPVNGGGS